MEKDCLIRTLVEVESYRWMNEWTDGYDLDI